MKTTQSNQWYDLEYIELTQFKYNLFLVTDKLLIIKSIQFKIRLRGYQLPWIELMNKYKLKYKLNYDFNFNIKSSVCLCVSQNKLFKK